MSSQPSASVSTAVSTTLTTTMSGTSHPRPALDMNYVRELTRGLPDDIGFGVPGLTLFGRRTATTSAGNF